MATAYKTPGVYVEEIPKFPPSIAPVETAIPAFVGYTEKAIKDGVSLLRKPTRIESIAEYEAWFGVGPSQDVTVTLDTNDQFVRAIGNGKYYLYDSLRLFYANGGGNCYIVSIGGYTAHALADFAPGLLELEKEDEPTILLAPDAVGLDSNGLASVQVTALTQCNKLMDRVVVCDQLVSRTSGEFKTQVDAFRNNIGIDYLKYGAAYGPWINANLPRKIYVRNLNIIRDVTNTPVLLESLTADPNILEKIADARLAATNVDNLKTLEGTESTPQTTLDDKLKKVLDDARGVIGNAASTAANMSTALKEFSKVAINILGHISDVRTGPYPAGSKFNIPKSVDDYLAKNSMKSAMQSVVYHHTHVNDAALFPGERLSLLTSNAALTKAALLLGYPDSATLLAEVAPGNFLPTNYPATVDTLPKRANVAMASLFAAVVESINFFRSIQSSMSEYEKTFNEALLETFGLFKTLVAKGAEGLNLIPPSGAIAGVYAAVDRDRGVWKAPANVSLRSVISPALKITDEQHGEYNVDVVAGKSINIIRSFTGKGTLVWGARTLAGNDLEWRYVSVRRFFNFVEESVKKATEHFTFEPNDANTWIKVQAMIENFLTTLWRQGALQGIKPEHAFYVRVGLGTTMTALDILEGRMIIEIGMAAVRPAEFIILRFSHKMAES